LSETTITILKSSKSSGTWAQYEAALKKWRQFCIDKQWNLNHVSINHVLSFLTDLYVKGLSYSSINTARSAISSTFSKIEGTSIGESKLVVNFMKGVNRLRPANPRYAVTWNPDSVLSFLIKWKNEKCNLRQITLKTVALLALSTGQRVQTLACIKIKNVKLVNPVQIFITDNLKTTSATNRNPVLILPFFQEKELCPALALKQYINVTNNIRKDKDKLFLGIVKPHNPVSSQSISRWLVEVLKLSGIDSSKFHAHSYRHASTSKAESAGVNIDTIFKRVGWTSKSKMFARYYKRPIENVTEFAENVLTIK
jgi:site-specific recombinase XerD